MDGVDLLVTPTGPTAATPLEGDLVTGDEADPRGLAPLINFTGPFDLTGFPAISIPCGFTESGLPVGLQLVARPWAGGPASGRRARLRASDRLARIACRRRFHA